MPEPICPDTPLERSFVEPDKHPLISLCMIVKNESRHLDRCLSSAAPHVDEIIVVDTGSTDNTVEIALAHGAKVSHFTWCQDFAAARNASLAQASGAWILVLDGDEEIVAGEQFRQVIQEQQEINIYEVELTDVSGCTEIDSPWKISTSIRRLFRNVPGLHYVGRFHEGIRYGSEEEQQQQQLDATICHIRHYGYRPELKTEKMENRNIPILELMRQDGEMPLMQLITLADHYEAAGQKQKAQECYQEAGDRLMPYLLEGKKPEQTGYVRFLMFKLAWQAMDAEDYETAQLILNNGLAWFPDYPPLSYEAGLLMFYLGFHRGAIAYFEACLRMGEADTYTKAEPFDRKYITAHPAFSLGYAWMQLQQWQNATHAFHQCLSFDPDYEPAKQQLASITHCL